MGRGENTDVLELFDELENADGSSRFDASDAPVYGGSQIDIVTWIEGARSVVTQLNKMDPAKDTKEVLALVKTLIAGINDSPRPEPHIYGGSLASVSGHLPSERSRAIYPSERSRAIYQREMISVALVNYLADPGSGSIAILKTALTNEADRREFLEISRSARSMVVYCEDKIPSGIDGIAECCRVKPPTVKRWLSGAACGSIYELREISAVIYYLDQFEGWTSDKIRDWLSTPTMIDDTNQSPFDYINGRRWGRSWIRVARNLLQIDVDPLVEWARPDER